jgi:DNA-binding NarL/FixJ family response regulator
MHSRFSTEKTSADTKGLITKSFGMPVLASSRLRILVADDHAIFRECLTRFLQESPGLDIVGNAKDGLQAVELATLLHPDIVIMDIDMPRMDGIEATRQIAKTLPHVRIIGLSMHDHKDIAAQIMSAGAVCCFMKDGPMEQLLAALQF